MMELMRNESRDNRNDWRLLGKSLYNKCVIRCEKRVRGKNADSWAKCVRKCAGKVRVRGKGAGSWVKCVRKCAGKVRMMIELSNR